MTDGIETEIIGLDDLKTTIRVLKQDAKFKGGRFAARKAAVHIQEKVISNVSRLDDPKTPTNISKNVAVRWSNRHFKSTGNLMFRIGILGGARKYVDNRENVRKDRVGKGYAVGGDSGNPGGDTYYWRFLEFGSSRHPAKHTVSKSLEDNVDSAIEVFAVNYRKALERAVRRAEKMAKKK